MDSHVNQGDVFAGIREYESPDVLKPPVSPAHSSSSADDYFVVHDDQEQENVFATADNYVDCSKYVNETLTRYGLPSPIRIERMDVTDRVRTLNALHSLIQDKQTAARQQDEMQMELAKLREERERSHHRVLDLKQVIDTKDKEKWDREMRLRNLQAEYSSVEKKLRTQIDELQKKCTQIKNRDKQYKHDLRKRELEYEKLQEKIKKMRGAPREKGGVISVSNSVLSRNQRKAWRGQNKGEEALQQQMQEAYEARIQELTEENANLRAGFKVLADRLDETLESHGGIYKNIPEDDLEIKVDYPDEVAEALVTYDPATQLSMPYQVAGEAFADGFDAKLRLLQMKIDAMSKISTGAKTKSMLEKELAEAKELLRRQNELLKEAVSQQEPDYRPRTPPNKRWSTNLEGITEHEEKFAEDRRKLEEEERVLRQQREELEADFSLNESFSSDLTSSPQKHTSSQPRASPERRQVREQIPSHERQQSSSSNVSRTSGSSRDGRQRAAKRGKKPSKLVQIEDADLHNFSPPTSPE